jgi:hypothetical protein
MTDQRNLGHVVRGNFNSARLAIVPTSVNDLPTPAANAVKFRSLDRWNVSPLY